MTTLSDGTTSLVPMLVLGYTTTREPRTVVHAVIGRPDPDVTLRPAALRNGTLRILCADVAAAQAMVDLHAQGLPLTLSEDDLPSLDMAYVVDGPITSSLDDETRVRWVVEVGYREVLP